MSIVIAVIAGVVLGLVWGNEWGALVGGTLGWLVVRSLQQQRRIGELQRALDDTRASAAPPDLGDARVQPTAGATAAAEAALAASSAAPNVAKAASARAVPAAAATASATADDAGARATAPLPAPPASSASPPRAAPPAPPRPDALAPIKAWLFGGNTIVKAGVGILFVGLAFLAKFASEHVQVPVEFRLATIGAVALVLLALGWRLRGQRPGYAQVLQGGAVAVLYLTLFVAFRFYGVLAVTPVFALMVAVAALAAALAVLQDARALAVIGALGGFAAPLLISTGSGNHVALFSYYLVLDLGIAAVAWHRDWRALNLIGFFGTFIVASVWGVLKYRPENYASSQAFLIAFFIVFIVVMLLPLRRPVARVAPAARDTSPEPADAGDDRRSESRWLQGSLLFGLPTITFVLQHGLVRDTEYGSALSALVLAAVYVALALWMRGRPRLVAAFDASLAIATVLLTLVIPLALDARSTAGAWALEGAGLVWLGLRQRRGVARAFGYALLLAAGAAMEVAAQRHGAPTQVVNGYLFNALMVAAASLAAALFVQRHCSAAARLEGSRRALECWAEPLLIGWATLWLLGAAGLQIENFVDSRWRLAAWLASSSAIALLYALLSLRLAWPRVALPAMAHAPLHMLGALIVAATLMRPLADGGWWAWPLALLVHGVVVWRVAPRWPAVARDVVHALGVLALALLGALQGRAITAGWGDAASAWAWLGWLVVPAVLLIALPRPALARHWPVVAAPAAYQWIASLVLAAALLAWTLLANVASSGAALPLPHLPLANPLDLGIATALVAVALWLRSPAARSELARSPHLGAALLGMAGFVWVNAIVVRGFHHYGGVPFRFDAWVSSLAVQTGITLLWAATALVLMWLAARRMARLPWMVGAALLAAVVVKLALVDLSGTGTVTRIVSFIGVGALMLVIGYVAPLPAKAQSHAAA